MTKDLLIVHAILKVVSLNLKQTSVVLLRVTNSPFDSDISYLDRKFVSFSSTMSLCLLLTGAK